MTDFDEHQRGTARALGYGDDVDGMNRDHDPLHRATCRWLGVVSHSMRVAAGETLTLAEQHLAELEETAVMALQKFMRHSGAIVP